MPAHDETKRSHWRDISRAVQLQRMLEVLKAADAPYTRKDVRLALEARGYDIEAIPTVIWEISQNTGYSTSGGVRFPDGKWRYWLTAAPGWTPRWRVNKQYQVVPFDAPDEGVAINAGQPGQSFEPEEEEQQGPATCPQCGAETDGGFCSEEHKREFFKRA